MSANEIKTVKRRREISLNTLCFEVTASDCLSWGDIHVRKLCICISARHILFNRQFQSLEKPMPPLKHTQDEWTDFWSRPKNGSCLRRTLRDISSALAPAYSRNSSFPALLMLWYSHWVHHWAKAEQLSIWIASHNWRITTTNLFQKQFNEDTKAMVTCALDSSYIFLPLSLL